MNTILIRGKWLSLNKKLEIDLVLDVITLIINQAKYVLEVAMLYL